MIDIDAMIEEGARAARNVQRESDGNPPYSDEEWQQFLHFVETIPGSRAAYHMKAIRAALAPAIRRLAAVVMERNYVAGKNGNIGRYAQGQAAEDLRAIADQIEKGE